MVLHTVSRAFLRSARYHLFRRLRVPGYLDINEGRGQRIHAEAYEDEDAYTHFLEFLHHNPDVRAYIRELKLVGASSSPSESRPDTVDSTPTPRRELYAASRGGLCMYSMRIPLSSSTNEA